MTISRVEKIRLPQNDKSSSIPKIFSGMDRELLEYFKPDQEGSPAVWVVLKKDLDDTGTKLASLVGRASGDIISFEGESNNQTTRNFTFLTSQLPDFELNSAKISFNNEDFAKLQIISASPLTTKIQATIVRGYYSHAGSTFRG